MVSRAFNHYLNSFRGIPHGIWLLALVSLVNRCGGMVIAFITLYLTQKLGFRIEQAGLVMSFFGFGAIAGAYAGGWLTDKFGSFRVQFWSLFLGGLALIGLLQIQNFYPMCLAVLLMAFVTETFRPANSVAVVKFSTNENRTRSFSLMRLSFNLGWTLAPALGGAIVASFGWNSLFYIDGLTCIAAAGVLYLTLRDGKNVEISSEKLAENLGENLSSSENVQPTRDPLFRIFWLFSTIAGIIFMQMLWTVPVFFKENYHWDEWTIGWVLALNGAIVALVEMPLIFSIEKRRNPMNWVRLGIVLYAFGYLFFVISPVEMAIFGAVIYMLMMSFGEIFVMPFCATWVTFRAGAGKQGKYMAFYMMSYSVANILSPALGTQLIAHFGYNSLWILMMVLCVVAWFGFRWIENVETPKIGAAVEVG